MCVCIRDVLYSLEVTYICCICFESNVNIIPHTHIFAYACVYRATCTHAAYAAGRQSTFLFVSISVLKLFQSEKSSWGIWNQFICWSVFLEAKTKLTFIITLILRITSDLSLTSSYLNDTLATTLQLLGSHFLSFQHLFNKHTFKTHLLKSLLFNEVHFVSLINRLILHFVYTPLHSPTLKESHLYFIAYWLRYTQPTFSTLAQTVYTISIRQQTENMEAANTHQMHFTSTGSPPSFSHLNSTLLSI